ncbi:YfiR family protein [Corallincola holothuriorum]|uniref:YfiR family protein n=1 Tax=Corallincola holothuriorum TaxID=2282215 RepID=UPI001314E053|nr:YfiR family protein [Corallincola holothuriorum]
MRDQVKAKLKVFGATHWNISVGFRSSLFLLLLWLPNLLSAVELDATKLRAAFLYQITKFVSWPDSVLSEQQALNACFVGQQVEDLAALFRRATEGKESQGRALQTLYFHKWQGLHQYQSTQFCHLVFSFEQGKGFKLAQQLSESQTLFVGNDVVALKAGAMFALPIASNKISILVNQNMLDRSQLKVQARFLRLAKVWKGATDDDV